MDNVERGLKIIDIFTDLREHVNKIGGKLNQDKGFIDENPSCGSTACIGGWLADYFKTVVYSSGRRCFEEGIRELENKLGVTCIKSFIWNSRLWHNAMGGDVFAIRNDAYIRTNSQKTIGLDEVCSDWVQFGYNLVAEGEKL